MKLLLSFAFLVGFAFNLQAQDTEMTEPDPLIAVVEACQDALALGDKSTAFSIARKIRKEAIRRFSDEPKQLAPLLLLYADAAASYKDAATLIAYREALVAYERAFGRDGEQLIEPMMRAAREALARKYRVEAFNLFQRTIELSNQYGQGYVAQAAIAKTGIASLHLRVGELTAARTYLDEALVTDARSLSALDLGWIYHVSADTNLALENWRAADEHYTQAYGYYEGVNRNARDLRTILRRLIKANHMMGAPERATNFCQLYAEKRDWGSRMLFDPSDKITNRRADNVATVKVEYTINHQCRAVEVVVTSAGGMDPLRVREIIEDAYWLPRYRNGVATRTELQRISSFIVAD